MFEFLEDTNWMGFFVLEAIGLAVALFMLIVWKRMDFNVGLVTKILILAGTLPASYIFTKIFLNE